MNRELLEVYSDYLLSSLSHTTATGLSALTGGAVSHDKITRFLSSDDFGPKQLWQLVKPFVRRFESGDGVLIIDDTVEEKPYKTRASWCAPVCQNADCRSFQIVS